MALAIDPETHDEVKRQLARCEHECGETMLEIANLRSDLARKDAEIGDLKASLAHMGGHLETELQEADKLRAEIAKLQRWVKLAVDAYNSGDEDDCCVACMTISDEQQGESGS